MVVPERGKFHAEQPALDGTSPGSDRIWMVMTTSEQIGRVHPEYATFASDSG
jgi:hypothetical protein